MVQDRDSIDINTPAPGACNVWTSCPIAKEPISDAARQLGERIRTRRTQLGKSQEQLARDSSLHWSYLGQVERGRRNVTLHNILKLAEGLDVDPGEFLHDLRAPKA